MRDVLQAGGRTVDKKLSRSTSMLRPVTPQLVGLPSGKLGITEDTGFGGEALKSQKK